MYGVAGGNVVEFGHDNAVQQCVSGNDAPARQAKQPTGGSAEFGVGGLSSISEAGLWGSGV